MNTELLNKCINYNFERLFKELDYKWFSQGVYNLNIIGIRSNKSKCTNKFDDILIVDYVADDNRVREAYPITTTPGLYYMNHPCNGIGTAILVPDQYPKCWRLGSHKGKYTALVQCNPVAVYRDSNKDDVYNLDPVTTTNGIYGINIHKANTNGESYLVDKWSAGCQVFQSAKDFKHFIKLCREQEARYSNSFTYTLLDEKELI